MTNGALSRKGGWDGRWWLPKHVGQGPDVVGSTLGRDGLNQSPSSGIYPVLDHYTGLGQSLARVLFVDSLGDVGQTVVQIPDAIKCVWIFGDLQEKEQKKAMGMISMQGPFS